MKDAMTKSKKRATFAIFLALATCSLLTNAPALAVESESESRDWDGIFLRRSAELTLGMFSLGAFLNARKLAPIDDAFVRQAARFERTAWKLVEGPEMRPPALAAMARIDRLIDGKPNIGAVRLTLVPEGAVVNPFSAPSAKETTVTYFNRGIAAELGLDKVPGGLPDPKGFGTDFDVGRIKHIHVITPDDLRRVHVNADKVARILPQTQTVRRIYRRVGYAGLAGVLLLIGFEAYEHIVGGVKNSAGSHWMPEPVDVDESRFTPPR